MVYGVDKITGNFVNTGVWKINDFFKNLFAGKKTFTSFSLNFEGKESPTNSR